MCLLSPPVLFSCLCEWPVLKGKWASLSSMSWPKSHCLYFPVSLLQWHFGATLGHTVNADWEGMKIFAVNSRRKEYGMNYVSQSSKLDSQDGPPLQHHTCMMRNAKRFSSAHRTCSSRISWVQTFLLFPCQFCQLCLSFFPFLFSLLYASLPSCREQSIDALFLILCPNNQSLWV